MYYFDNAATTRVSPEAHEAAMPFLFTEYGNPGSSHSLGKKAGAALDKARSQVAGVFNSTPEHIVFTSGGSEANSLVFGGLRHRLMKSGKTDILISAVEHDSVLRAAEVLEPYGFRIVPIPVMSNGSVDIGTFTDLLRDLPDAGLVSVMYVNNETGAVNPVAEIAAACRAKGVYYHADCVQAAGAFPLDSHALCFDFATISAHKFHGMKGAGALYIRDVREPLPLDPIICGGEAQERGLRGGTENVPAIAAMGAVCELIPGSLQETNVYVSTIKQVFYKKLTAELEARGLSDILAVNGPSPMTPGRILNLRFNGVDNETLLLMLDSEGLCASAGSACRAHEVTPSRTLLAMGLTPDEARSSVRFSFSEFNDTDETEQGAEIVARCVSFLLNSSPAAEEDPDA